MGSLEFTVGFCIKVLVPTAVMHSPCTHHTLTMHLPCAHHALTMHSPYTHHALAVHSPCTCVLTMHVCAHRCAKAVEEIELSGISVHLETRPAATQPHVLMHGHLRKRRTNVRLGGGLPL